MFEEKQLIDSYTIRSVSEDEYHQFRAIYEPTIFNNRFDIYTQKALSAQEKDSLESLQSGLGNPYQLRLGFFDQQQMIGWSYGQQISADTFRMVTSGMMPEHQRKGLYSAFLKHLADHLKMIGFQILFSRHYATDNQVIIPKLRFGFLISGFELTDEFGLLLRLSYFFNETRRKAMHVRSGYQQPDQEIKALIRSYD